MSGLLRRGLVRPTVLYQRNCSLKHFLQRKKHTGAQQTNRPISLVILDKDGTLVQFGVGWSHWVRQFSQGLEETTGLVLGDKLFNLFGYDLQSQKWREGLMCDSPGNIKLELAKFLEFEGVHKETSMMAVEQCFDKVDKHLFTKHDVVPIDDPMAICKTLKHFQIKTALCTMDSKVSTNLMMAQLGLENIFDYIMCGDDALAEPKPSPSNVFHICATLNIAPVETALVGDAKRDVEMGRNANVGLNIGVLSGVCDREELETDADVVAKSVKAALGHFLPDGYTKVLEELSE